MAVFAKDDTALGKYAASVPVPEFESTSFNQPKPLSRAKVAIVTTAALHREGRDGFELGGGFAADINVVYPIDRLEEMAENGTIGGVADNHYAFAGNQSETVSEIRLDSGPLCAKAMLDEGVDVVLLTGT
jgi:D-proline reductase (dithiol) PrdB